MKASAPGITLKTVAAKAGLGRSTVGLILNGRGDELGIPAETQAKVHKVAANLGYRPNSLALGLAGKKTQTIGLILPSGPFYPQNLMPQDISLRLHRRGYQTYLVDSLQDPDVMLESLKEMATRRVDGICFHMKLPIPPKVREALNQFPATVLISNIPIPRTDFRAHVIYLDMVPAIDDIVDHFVQTGRRRPMIVTSVNDAMTNLEKIGPFRDALRRQGLDASEEGTIFGVNAGIPRDSDYYTVFRDAFEAQRLEDRDFDALFCTCDEAAVAAIRYLTEKGRRVPDDVAVVGLNNTPMIQGYKPSIASISWNHVEAFDLIEARMVERLKKPDAVPGYDEAPLKFIRRESAG
ncbi:MAG: LacI family DNA-binding transcriptional regulator [Phycisphaerae bacterium]|nr:LacI family DNA-binding transcriptional regulator [Phycisphaerae bacterium]